jgi:hypothetical protein
MTDKLDSASADRLSTALEDLARHRIVRLHDTPLKLLAFQFLRGLAFGLGSVLGATILVSLLGIFLSQFEFIPVLGDWANRIILEIEQGRQ